MFPGPPVLEALFLGLHRGLCPWLSLGLFFFFKQCIVCLMQAVRIAPGHVYTQTCTCTCTHAGPRGSPRDLAWSRPRFPAPPCLQHPAPAGAAWAVWGDQRFSCRATREALCPSLSRKPWNYTRKADFREGAGGCGGQGPADCPLRTQAAPAFWGPLSRLWSREAPSS